MAPQEKVEMTPLHGMEWMKKILKYVTIKFDVFLNGADMVIEEEDQNDREDVYLGRV